MLFHLIRAFFLLTVTAEDFFGQNNKIPTNQWNNKDRSRNNGSKLKILQYNRSACIFIYLITGSLTFFFFSGLLFLTQCRLIWFQRRRPAYIVTIISWRYVRKCKKMQEWKKSCKMKIKSEMWIKEILTTRF